MQNIELPVRVKDIEKFETRNDISVNFYGFDDDVVFPMRITTRSKLHHVDLLYISNDGTQHYVLVNSQLSNNRSRMCMCKFCLRSCTSERVLSRQTFAKVSTP